MSIRDVRTRIRPQAFLNIRRSDTRRNLTFSWGRDGLASHELRFSVSISEPNNVSISLVKSLICVWCITIKLSPDWAWTVDAKVFASFLDWAYMPASSLISVLFSTFNFKYSAL